MKVSTVLIVVGCAGVAYLGGRMLMPAPKVAAPAPAGTKTQKVIGAIAAVVDGLQKIGVTKTTQDNAPEKAVMTTYGDLDSDATATATSAQAAPARSASFAEEVLMSGGGGVLGGLSARQTMGGN